MLIRIKFMTTAEYVIIIPCYNEDPTILKVVREIFKLNKNLEILLINDGSTDSFEDIDFTPFKSRLKIINHLETLGKGAAIKTGIKVLKRTNPNCKVILFDADDEIGSEAITTIINFYSQNKKCKVIFGSRYLGNNFYQNLNYGIIRFIANKTLTKLANYKLELKLTDMETAVKSFYINLIDETKLISNGFEIEPEITMMLSKTKENIFEIPITYNPRTKNEGKKISFKDGLKTLNYIFRNAK